MRLNIVIGVLTASLAVSSANSSKDKERERLFETVASQIRGMALETRVDELSPSTMEALLTVPRHVFVPDDQRDNAYLNRPLPIGHGQTISQPLIVALMTELLGVDASSRVLEVGAGSGYQAAVLSRIVDQVHTIEIIEPLAVSATVRLATLGYDNVTVRHSDGYYGWAENAPFDAIIVTAAAGHVPPPLIEQLRPGGKMAIPVGNPFVTQVLLLVEKDQDNNIHTRQVLPVRFVPLTGDR